MGPILTFQNDMDKEYGRADGPIIEEITVTSTSNLPPAAVDSNDSEGSIGSKTKMNVLVPFRGLGMGIPSKNHTRVNRTTKMCATRGKSSGTPGQKPAFYEKTSAKLCIGFLLPAMQLQQTHRKIPIATGKFALLNSKSNKCGCSKSSYMVRDF